MKIRSVLTMGAAAAITVALGTAPAASAATPASPGDFNGDGRRDVALGSPLGTVGGVAGGFVTVVYGGAAGPDTTRSQVISQAGPGVPGDVTADSRFGASLASADFDRDGYADLAIGAPFEDVDGSVNAGSVTVVYGSAGGLSSRAARFVLAPSLRVHKARFGESLAAAEFASGGAPDLAVAAPGGEAIWVYDDVATAGTSGTRVPLNDVENHVSEIRLIAADFTGDGRPDLVTSRLNNLDGIDIGRVDLYSGSASGLSLLVPNAAPGGRQAAAGDINGDGRADLVTRMFESEDPEVNGGTVAVNLATGTGFRRQLLVTQDTSGVPGTGEQGDGFGAGLAVGDLNGDGKGDVAIGAPGEDIGTVADAGAFTVLYGTASGVTTAGAQQIGQNTADVPGNAETRDAFGYELSVANVTGDAKADLTVSAYGENGTEGAVWLFPGRAGGLTGAGSTAFNPVTLGISGRTAHLGDVMLP
ncbi:FG-GAP-like repeat-containing protein [Actinomadura alba]|uniref:FG-GAP repeat protein n=1 Tax=Actinomadura alba TaxID=406431 RepID=A0ABR7LKY0_9ACTN|nr:FG-GAP-like repeat-containing protein [Actinomadura alba]MBC6465333.1 FG-GAP repeat protein [Actinomadura alba]